MGKQATSNAIDSIDPQMARFKLFEYAFGHYLVAKFAGLENLTFTSGTLYHHAVELFLKAQLVKSRPLSELRNDYVHKLGKLWEAFKDDFPNEDLSGFDGLIADLDCWWKIRYPEDLLINGGRLAIGRGDTSGVSNESYGQGMRSVPKYDLTGQVGRPHHRPAKRQHAGANRDDSRAG
jgi:hypothetical protein